MVSANNQVLTIEDINGQVLKPKISGIQEVVISTNKGCIDVIIERKKAVLTNLTKAPELVYDKKMPNDFKGKVFKTTANLLYESEWWALNKAEV